MSLIRGTLLIGKFRTQRDLNAMSWEDQRNTLITESPDARATMSVSIRG